MLLAVGALVDIFVEHDHEEAAFQGAIRRNFQLRQDVEREGGPLEKSSDWRLWEEDDGMRPQPLVGGGHTPSSPNAQRPSVQELALGDTEKRRQWIDNELEVEELSRRVETNVDIAHDLVACGVIGTIIFFAKLVVRPSHEDASMFLLEALETFDKLYFVRFCFLFGFLTFR